MVTENITLAGFMGTGKSTVGRLLAGVLHREFVDMDAVIEARQGMPASRIFAEKGEPFFRKLERDLVKELAGRRGLVVAAGGGMALNQDNLRQMANAGPVICLTADPDTVARRLGDVRTRPLLADPDPARVLENVAKLMAQRQSAYAGIPCQVATDGLTPGDVVKKIMDIIPPRFYE